MKVALVAAVAAALLAVAAVTPVASQGVTDVDILNFALNLEYLEAEFYLYAVTGSGIPSQYRGGGPRSTGGREADFCRKSVKRIATEIATDELNHVIFLRTALGSAAVPIPLLNIGTAFADAADAALSTKLRPRFSPYRESDYDLLFLHGAFIFEDVGVTAYKGAAALIASKAYLDAAAGILSVEAYHAGSIRTQLYQKADVRVRPYGVRVKDIVAAISALRGAVGGGKDEGIVKDRAANIVPTDGNSIAFGRTTAEVLPIVYLGTAGGGGFFPNGLNGLIK